MGAGPHDYPDLDDRCRRRYPRDRHVVLLARAVCGSVHRRRPRRCGRGRWRVRFRRTVRRLGRGVAVLRRHVERGAGHLPGEGRTRHALGSTPMTVRRLEPYAVTIFAEMSALAARIGAVNLGQGFPDEDGPPAMLKAAENAIAEGVNQYPPGLGIAPLREAIAAQRKRHFGTDYD